DCSRRLPSATDGQWRRLPVPCGRRTAAALSIGPYPADAAAPWLPVHGRRSRAVTATGEFPPDHPRGERSVNSHLPRHISEIPRSARCALHPPVLPPLATPARPR